jgi:hypothetical protein
MKRSEKQMDTKADKGFPPTFSDMWKEARKNMIAFVDGYADLQKAYEDSEAPYTLAWVKTQLDDGAPYEGAVSDALNEVLSDLIGIGEVLDEIFQTENSIRDAASEIQDAFDYMQLILSGEIDATEAAEQAIRNLEDAQEKLEAILGKREETAV